MAIPRIRFVTFDATGTLLRPRERIGATYIAHWQRVASASPEPAFSLSSTRREVLERVVDARFPLAFRDHARRFPNFGRSTLSTTTGSSWWSRVILSALPDELVHAIPVEKQQELTATLYEHYATGDAWSVFDDVTPALERLRERRVIMGVVSDFDERLPRILSELGLAPFFNVVTTSWEFGEPKPARAIFEHTFRALAEKDGGIVLPSEFLHVGDHAGRDYRGATAIGAHARLLIRGKKSSEAELETVPREETVSTLRDLLPLLP